MSTLSQIAPRLYKAHSQAKANLLELDRDWSKLEDDRVRLERLVAHRELQLVRAYNRSSGRYIRIRQEKLSVAEKALDRVNARREENQGARWLIVWDGRGRNLHKVK